MTRSIKSIRMALMATALGALFAAPAMAQQYDDENAGPSESIIVTAPDFHAERNNLGLPGKLSLTRPVSYSDLDLNTRAGASELRARVRDTAREICSQLNDAYPVREQPGEPKCFETAYKSGMTHAEEAIRTVRFHNWR
jgi:UrcA family protein